MQALIDLLNDEGWTNSLEDLGVTLKAVNDELLQGICKDQEVMARKIIFIPKPQSKRDCLKR